MTSIYNNQIYLQCDNVLFSISFIEVNKIIVFIILYVNNAIAWITERCRQRKQIRGVAVLMAREARGGGRDISLPRFVSAREAGRGEVFQLNADYIALSRYWKYIDSQASSRFTLVSTRVGAVHPLT